MVVKHQNCTIRGIIAVLVFIALVGPSYAGSQDRPPLPLPPSLYYDGVPISPYCFSYNPYSEESLEYFPADCSLDEGLLIREREVTEKKTYVSYDSTEFGGFAGYDGYTYLGQYKNTDYINHYWSGGGSGHFSEVFGLSREQDRFKIIDHFVGGDRCNGGDLSAEITQEGILSSFSITPYDLISLPYDGDSPYATYDEINVCATCCVGRLAMIKGEIVSFNLNKDYHSHSYGSDEGGKIKQVCLDHLISSHLGDNQSVFSNDELNIFIKSIEDNCFKVE